MKIKMIKKAALLLALITVLTAFQGLFSLSVFADEATDAATDAGTDEGSSTGTGTEEEPVEELPDYTKIKYRPVRPSWTISNPNWLMMKTAIRWGAIISLPKGATIICMPTHFRARSFG